MKLLITALCIIFVRWNERWIRANKIFLPPRLYSKRFLHDSRKVRQKKKLFVKIVYERILFSIAVLPSQNANRLSDGKKRFDVKRFQHKKSIRIFAPKITVTHSHSSDQRFPPVEKADIFAWVNPTKGKLLDQFSAKSPPLSRAVLWK